MKEYAVYSVNGPVVKIKGKTDLALSETVRVGKAGLLGEVLSVTDRETTLEVYETTAGLSVGEPIRPLGHSLSILLGPGLLGSIYDGVGRPLTKIALGGEWILPGADFPAVDTEKKYPIHLTVKDGDRLTGGSIFGETKETSALLHRLLLPPDAEGVVRQPVPDGSYTVTDTLFYLETSGGDRVPVAASHTWPVRKPRPTAQRLPSEKPLLTGERIIDVLFPIAKGGTAAIPGGFGTGKTVVQHQLAKFSEADVIVYVGCGERGNEMTQVLEEFSHLTDPRTGKSMLERTVLIANTSNMPVAAREASIYTGITIAEYYRDMGYSVLMLADSTSRWAEALRELSGRLEEMPAEEGYPAYLPSRLASFYERAGCVTALSGREGAVSIVGAVSPQGNDFSEPVTQNTKRFTGCFWALEKSLAYARHYPAINWNESYSEYAPELSEYYRTAAGEDFPALRQEAASLLSEENELFEIVRLIGSDLLAEEQKLLLEIARVIRVGFLQQDAMHPDDCFVTLEKQYRHLRMILHVYDAMKRFPKLRIPIKRLQESGIFDRMIRKKFEVKNDHPEAFTAFEEEILQEIDGILQRETEKGGENL